MRDIPPPPAFDGDLSRLADFVVDRVLPSRYAVEAFHRALTDYVQAADPLFVIRAPSPAKHERGTVATTRGGSRVRFSDNSPAWQVHFTLFQGEVGTFDDFGSYVEDLPTHFFEVSRRVPKSVSKAGWYVAHIHAVKDRQTPFEEWERDDAVRRFIRNIHPCNVFFVPLEHRIIGEDASVIAHFADRFRAIYGPLWDDFERLAGSEPASSPKPLRRAASALRVRSPNLDDAHVTARKPLAAGPAIISYRRSRLCFKRDAIEPLEAGDPFEIVTPSGTYRMTKADFYRDFSNVPGTASYRDRGEYHFRVAPRKAHRYLVS